MGEEDDPSVVPVSAPPSPPLQAETPPPPSQPPTPAEARPQFDPSLIGIIKRKALIKELAATYHAECISCCRELLDLQKKWEEQPYTEMKALEEPRREIPRLPKRTKKNY